MTTRTEAYADTHCLLRRQIAIMKPLVKFGRPALPDLYFNILTNLNIDMIKSFPLDYMHLICLGVMKKLLISWVKGPLTARIGKSNCDNLSAYLEYLSKFITIDFAKKSRSLRELMRWKATEFRLFLLYLGPVVLKTILRSKYYQHFYYSM